MLRVLPVQDKLLLQEGLKNRVWRDFPRFIYPIRCQYSRNLEQPDLLQEGHERGSGKTSNMAFSLRKLR